MSQDSGSQSAGLSPSFVSASNFTATSSNQPGIASTSSASNDTVHASSHDTENKENVQASSSSSSSSSIHVRPPSIILSYHNGSVSFPFICPPETSSSCRHHRSQKESDELDSSPAKPAPKPKFQDYCVSCPLWLGIRSRQNSKVLFVHSC